MTVFDTKEIILESETEMIPVKDDLNKLYDETIGLYLKGEFQNYHPNLFKNLTKQSYLNLN